VKIHTLIFICIIGLTLHACTPKQYGSRYNDDSKSFYYRISVVDVSGNPVQGATVTTTTKYAGTMISSKEATTGSDGMLSETITSGKYTSPTVAFKVHKDSYYDNSGTIFLSADKVTERKVYIYTSNDYYLKEFVGTKLEGQIRNNVRNFVSTMLVNGYGTESEVRPRSIGTSQFKNKSYFTITLDNTNVYNSLKLNKYGIGRVMFDEVVSKMLTPLNDLAIDKRSIYGYDIIVTTRHKPFTEQYAIGDKVVYRFIMQENAVRRYKDKEISGQKLLDDSVILMDNERIELKLQ